MTNFLHALRPLLQSAQDRTVLEELLECCGNLEPEHVSEDRKSGASRENPSRGLYRWQSMLAAKPIANRTADSHGSAG